MIKKVSLITLKIVISIATLVLLFLALRWLGFKGVVGFFSGMAIMAYVFMSQNNMMLALINILDKSKKKKVEDYVKEIKDDG